MMLFDLGDGLLDLEGIANKVSAGLPKDRDSFAEAAAKTVETALGSIKDSYRITCALQEILRDAELEEAMADTGILPDISGKLEQLLRPT